MLHNTVGSIEEMKRAISKAGPILKVLFAAEGLGGDESAPRLLSSASHRVVAKEAGWISPHARTSGMA